MGLANAKLDKVSLAIRGRKQLDVSAIFVLDLVGLGVLEAEADAITLVNPETPLYAGVVPVGHVVISCSDSGGQDCQQRERLEQHI